MADFGKEQNMSELLARIFKEKRWQHRLQLHAVFKFWESAVGREIAAKARPYIIRGHVLIVHVVDSVWMQHLHLQKIHILENINKRLTDQKIEDIRFQLETTEQKKESKKTETAPVWPLDHKRVQEFDKMITSLEDEGLQKTMKRLWSKFEGLRYLKKE